MDGSGAVPTQQTKDSPGQEIHSQAQASQETTSEPNLPQTSQKSDNSSLAVSSQINAQQSPSQSEYAHVFVSEQLTQEVREMILATETAIELNLSGGVHTEKGKTQKNLLNLCFYVTHNRTLDIGALNWATEYARTAIGITLDDYYENDPLKIPIPIATYLIRQSEIPPQKRKIQLPPRYSPVSDDSFPPSPSAEAPTEEAQAPTPKDGEDRSEQNEEGNNVPPLIPLLTHTMASPVNRDCSEAAPPLTGRKIKAIAPRILFDEPNESDWKFVQRWLNYFEGGEDISDECLLWLLIRIVNMNKKEIGLQGAK